MVFSNPKMLLLLLLLPMIVIIGLFQRKRLRWPVLIIRLLVVTLIILALANPIMGLQQQHTSPSLVVLVDQSDSLTPAGQAELRARTTQLVQAWESVAIPSQGNTRKVTHRQAQTFWFGRAIRNPGHGESDSAMTSHNLSSLDPSATNLADALRLGREMLAASGGRIVLLSDGIPTATSPGVPAASEVLYEAEQAAIAGIPIDVWPIAPYQGPELRVAHLEAHPQVVRVGDSYRIRLTVESAPLPPSRITTAPTTTLALLRLWETPPDGGEQLLAQEQIPLQPGNTVSRVFPVTARSSGVVAFRAELTGMDETADTFAQNNQARVTAIIAAKPRILLVEGHEGLASKLESAFWNSAIESEVIAPKNLPTRLSDLQWYDGMILLNVASHQLSVAQMSSIEAFVKSEGRGLVVTGGPESYSLGGYKGTALERLLPVLLDPPPRPQRSTVALLLIIDRSASMSVPLDISKFDMAKEAAILSTEMLQAEDRIGILAFDTRNEWVIPFQPIGYGASLKQIQDAIAMLPLGGGTDIYGSLREGLPALMSQQASVRHAVLLTDGRSFTNDRNAYYQIVSMARNQDITLSAIAIGLDSDTELLNQLAQWGGGRYYFTENPSDIPRMTIQESEIARSAPMIESDFQAVLDTPHAILSGLTPAGFPLLHGYVATTRRPGAETILRTPDINPELSSPILSTWQYGLGRVVAWTSSATEPWGSSWMAWGEYAPFWNQLTRYTLPSPESGPIQISMLPTSGGVHIAVDAIGPGSRPINFADVQATITLPNGRVQMVPLLQTGPGRYAEQFLLPVEGAYGIDVLLATEGGKETYRAQAGYVHPIPEEYQANWMFPASQANLAVGASEPLQGVSLLERIATTTDGQVIQDETALESFGQPPDTSIANNEQYAPGLFDPIRNALWFWLILTAILLWLLEISLQRR